jgi:hypothetical protein
MEQVPDFTTFGDQTFSAASSPQEAVAASQAFLKEDRASGMPTMQAAPDVFVTLHHGIKNPTSLEFLRDAEVRELNGQDEEAIARCNGNLARVMDTIVVRGTRRIGSQFMTRELADQLLIGDREQLLLAIREATFGPTVEFEKLPCPHCGDKVDLSYALSDVPVVKLKDPDQVEYRVDLRQGAVAVVRLPNGADQMKILSHADEPDAVQNTRMLSQCLLRVEYPDGDTVPGSPKLALELSMADRRTLLDFLMATQPGPRFNQAAFVHDGCGQEVRLPLNLAILFRGL